MSTYTKRAGTLTCDECHAIVTAGWRTLAAHTANHARAHQLGARQARIDAATKRDTPYVATESAPQTWDNGDISETAPSVTSTPPLVPRSDRSTLMNGNASRPVPPLDFRGVA